jgi:hypothetical protein
MMETYVAMAAGIVPTFVMCGLFVVALMRAAARDREMLAWLEGTGDQSH